jgi:TRAP-type transport system periplasmic protein
MKRFSFISRLISLAVIVAVLVVGFACAAPAAPTTAPSATTTVPAPVKVRELNFATYTPATHHVSVVLTQFCKDVEQQTNGSLKITLFPGETLAKSAEILDAVIKGGADAGFTLVGYNAGREPVMEITDLSLPNVKSCLQLGMIDWKIYQKFKPKEYDGIKVLGFINYALSGFNSNKPITKLSDVVGQQIRCAAGDSPMVKALGATPVAIPITEAYLAIQKGVADGCVGDYASTKSYKLAEVVKTSTEYFFRNTTGWYGMNQKTFDSLTPAQQKVLSDLGDKYVTVLGNSRDAEDIAGREYMVSQGVKFLKLDAGEPAKFDAALSPLRDKWIADKTAMGIPAKEIMDFTLAELAK